MATESDTKTQELVAIITEIRERVRARYPEGEARGLGAALPDLMSLLHARDAAQSKVAAIGTVNPRPPGLLNDIVQSMKRLIARSLGWFVRDQVEFNRAAMQALEATLESLNDVNRTLVAAGARIAELQKQNDALRAEASELKDIRVHWLRWKEEWERKLTQNEVHYLRSLADLQAAAEARAASADASYRHSMTLQHREFSSEIEDAVEKVHARFWSDLERIRLEYEKVIHNELRVIRQKAFAAAATSSRPLPAADVTPTLDYARFADRFRGTETYVRSNFEFYRPWFRNRTAVLDIGCGRGEFLELMREMDVPARGIELDPESVAVCRSKGLQADEADAFDFLRAEPAAFDAILASQVVEHLPPDRLPEFVKLCASCLKAGGLLAFETPNPECLAIFATHFYLDPTHTKPVPSGLLAFYMEEQGLGAIEVHKLSPAIETMPSLAELPANFREAFFGGLDYAIIGRKL